MRLVSKMLPPGNKKPPESPKSQAFGFYVNMPSLFKLLVVVFIVVPLLASLGYCYLYLLNFWSQQTKNIVVEDPNLIIEEEWVELEKKMENEADLYPTCSSNMFNCTPNPWDSKIKTLPWMRRCDGNLDCWNGSDEKDCLECLTSFSCKAEDGIHLKCLNGMKLCNGFADCPDATDETLYCHRNTTCANDEFSCGEEKNGHRKCFPNSFKCDGDPYYCISNYYHGKQTCDECTGYARQCSISYGSGTRCVSITDMCDGRVDCLDHRDENFLHCNQTLSECPGQCNIDKNNKEENSQMGQFRWTMYEMLGQSSNLHCSDNRWYSPIIGCSGEHSECDGQCEKCMPNAFHCEEEKKCISSAKICDGVNDCANGRDEKNCNKTLACDAEKNLCNGVCNCMPDCNDEKNCTNCKENKKLEEGRLKNLYMEEYPKLYNTSFATSWLGYQAHAFKCPKEKTCISINKRCDGRKDCSDGCDEENCECFECMIHPHQTYVCQEGKRCFRFDEVCDENFESQCPNATKLDVEHCELLKMKSDQIKLY